jgi:predicted transcriptional regulator
LPPQFPPPDPEAEGLPKTIRLPRVLWKRLDAIAKAEKKSRNFVVEFFLTWAADDYEAAKKGTRK